MAKTYSMRNRSDRLENAKPEAAAEIFEASADPFTSLAAAAEACGLNKDAASALAKRLRTRYSPVNESMKEVTTKGLLQLIDDRTRKALEYMDDVAFAKAGLKDLAIAMGILIEKRQLLRGEPTQILSVEERSNLNELLPSVIKEAQRRGMTIDSAPLDAMSADGAEQLILPGPEKPIKKWDQRLASKVSYAKSEEMRGRPVPGIINTET